MKLNIRMPKINGEVVPLIYVADAFAREKATGFRNSEFHKPTYDGVIKSACELLAIEVQKGNLKVCDQFGIAKSPEELVEASRRTGTSIKLTNYLVDPDWEALKTDHPDAEISLGVWDFTRINLGPVRDTCLCKVSCYYVTLEHLNYGGVFGGSSFVLDTDSPPWVDERGVIDSTNKNLVCPPPLPTTDSTTSAAGKNGQYSPDPGNMASERCATDENNEVMNKTDDTNSNPRAEVDSPEARAKQFESKTEIPGKLPNTSVGKLAIKAAWQIEKEKGRVADRDQVIRKLQEWAALGTAPNVLQEADKPKGGVRWLTTRYARKLYDLEACRKTLIKWNKSRAMTTSYVK